MRQVPMADGLPSEAIAAMLRQHNLGFDGSKYERTYDYCEGEGSGPHHRLVITVQPTANAEVPVSSYVQYYRANSVMDDLVELALRPEDHKKLVKAFLEARNPWVKGITWLVTADTMVAERMTRLQVIGTFEVFSQTYAYEYTKSFTVDEIMDLNVRSQDDIAYHYQLKYWQECLGHLHHFVGSFAAEHITSMAGEMLPLLMGTNPTSTALRNEATKQFRSKQDSAIMFSVHPVVARRKRRRILKI